MTAHAGEPRKQSREDWKKKEYKQEKPTERETKWRKKKKNTHTLNAPNHKNHSTHIIPWKENPNKMRNKHAPHNNGIKSNGMKITQ